MDAPSTYRKYAEECKRLAESMSPADKRVMLEIADAWLACAKQTEGKSTGKNAQQE